jgi:hypothetical protein
MPLFTNNSAFRYLIIHDDGAILMQQQKGHFIAIDRLQNSAVDRKYLADLIQMDAELPFTVIIDCFDEDFRLQTVTHVRGHDRQSVLERKSHTLFRSTPYRFSRVIGREDSGRRDDRAVFSAIAVAEKVDSWVDVILHNKGQILAISSVAYLAEQWLPILTETPATLNSPHLLISYDGYSGLRTTFMLNGLTLISRLVKREVSSTEHLLQMVKDQALQTRRYLESIKLLSNEDNLDCIFLHGEDAFNDLAVDLSPHTRLRTFRPATEYTDDSAKPSLFSSQFIPHSILQFGIKRSSFNIYARFDQTRFYWLRKARTFSHAASLTCLCSAIALALPNALATYQSYRSTQLTEAALLPLQIEYETLRNSFPATPISSSVMQMLVELHTEISQVSVQGLRLVASFSQLLSQRPDLGLQEISWVLREQESREQTSFGPATPATLTMAVLDNNYRYNLEVKAEVIDASNLLGVNERITTFIQDMERKADLQVVLRELPVDVQPTASVSLELDGSSAASAFSLSAWQRLPSEAQSRGRP